MFRAPQVKLALKGAAAACGTYLVHAAYRSTRCFKEDDVAYSFDDKTFHVYAHTKIVKMKSFERSDFEKMIKKSYHGEPIDEFNSILHEYIDDFHSVHTYRRAIAWVYEGESVLVNYNPHPFTEYVFDRQEIEEKYNVSLDSEDSTTIFDLARSIGFHRSERRHYGDVVSRKPGDCEEIYHKYRKELDRCSEGYSGRYPKWTPW